MGSKREFVAYLLCLIIIGIVLMKYLRPGVCIGEEKDLDREHVRHPLQRELQTKNVTSVKTVYNAQGLREKIQTNSSPSYNIVETQKQRQRRIRDTCASYNTDVNLYQTRNLTISQLSSLSFIYVIPKFKLLYCSVPKAGCTSWKSLILRLTGHDDVLADMKKYGARSLHEAMLRHFRPLSALDPDKARDILQSYRAFMFVRNPYTRLLSAYRDKIILDINSKWRDEMLEWLVTADPQAAADVFTGKRIFTFEEFLRFYLSPVDNNPHWREYYRLCFPCFVKYDFIGKFEKMAEDSRYILKSLFHVDPSEGLSSSKRITNSSNHENLRDFYSRVPKDLLRRISVHGGITMDSELFNYDAPEIIQEILDSH